MTKLTVLESYVKDVKNGTVDGTASPEIRNETPATAWVDGKKALGVVVGSYCVSLGMKKAEEVGIGLVVANSEARFAKRCFELSEEGFQTRPIMEQERFIACKLLMKDTLHSLAAMVHLLCVRSAARM